MLSVSYQLQFESRNPWVSASAYVLDFCPLQWWIISTWPTRTILKVQFPNTLAGISNRTSLPMLMAVASSRSIHVRVCFNATRLLDALVSCLLPNPLRNCFIMMIWYNKLSKQACEKRWTKDIKSINCIETGTWVRQETWIRQEYNGFSHPKPSFIGGGHASKDFVTPSCVHCRCDWPHDPQPWGHSPSRTFTGSFRRPVRHWQANPL